MTHEFSGHLIGTKELERGVNAHRQQYGLWADEGAVTPSSGMTLAVAAITANEYVINGTIVSTAYAGGTIALSAADGTNPRRDLIHINSSGTVGKTDGTPAATPIAPDPGASELALAEVYVAAGATVIAEADITDKRQILSRPTWEHIDTQELPSTASSISFPGIDTGFKRFRLFFSPAATASLLVHLRLNNDSGSNYEYQSFYAASTTLAAARSTGQAQVVLDPNLNVFSGRTGLYVVHIVKQANTQAAQIHAQVQETIGANQPTLAFTGGTWLNTSDAISRIDLIASTSTFAASSVATLEGSRVP